MDVGFRLDSIEELSEWIASMEGLESLRLISIGKNDRPPKLELKPLSSLENLTDLDLFGNLPALQNDYFPHSIIVLSLWESKLENDPMPILAKLPNLSDLRLRLHSYTGKEMVSPSGGFPKLRTLVLWRLENLETWTVEEGAMPGLNELEIRCCHNLKELPDKLLNQSKIEKIILTNMEEDFATKISKKILEIQKPIWPVRCSSCNDYMKQVSIHSLIY